MGSAFRAFYFYVGPNADPKEQSINEIFNAIQSRKIPVAVAFPISPGALASHPLVERPIHINASIPCSCSKLHLIFGQVLLNFELAATDSP